MRDAPDMPGPAPPGSPAISFADRLLAETVRWSEADGARPIDDPGAEARARDAGGSFEQRLAVRAGHVQQAGRLGDSLDHVRRAIAVMVGAGVLLGLLGGAAAARTSLGGSGPEPANFFWLLISLLGVQTLLLLVWLLIMALRPRALAGGSFGGLAVGLGRRLAVRVHRGPDQVNAVQAIAGVLAGGRVGTWTLGAISHAIWVAFNVGAIILVLVLLSTRQYTFAWQSTILSARVYVPFTMALAEVPRRLGFAVPTEQQVRDSRWHGGTPVPAPGGEAAEEAWSGLLVGSLVSYGLAPRIVLLLVCTGMASRARQRFRLDVDRPGYQRLRDRLMPLRRSLGIIDHDDEGQAEVAPRGASPVERPAGPPAVIGFELAEPPVPWPPVLPGVSWVDLGLVDDRFGRVRAIDALRAGQTEPHRVVVICELTSTPDRGVRVFLEEVQAVVHRPIALLLTAGQALRRRGTGEQFDRRVDDWRRAGESAGIAAARVIEIDLHHGTDHSLGRLPALLELNGDGAVEATSTTSPRHLEAALDLVREHAGGWDAAPGAAEQADLHRAIGRLHREGHDRWRELLAAPLELRGDVVGQLRRGADRMVGLLPARLKASPRWLAAGAIAGAMGCVAAATLLAPVAITALPMWSGLGAALGGVLQLARKSRGEEPVGDTDAGADEAWGDAVRAGTLFAVLLELQGRSESSISTVLDEIFAESAPPLAEREDPGPWLDEVRHRFDLALAREGRS